ncbi:DEAD/DEAH box helicase [Oscillochloris sp. ZM17-4]|uniref:protein DpdJ n=1 Tax=Oscillochloris sp. ZM17-4 TaxID=2866714 RepID=UPI001C73A98D|nr:protein DpdJ [Oscillochloris sp. ZM17-4]MBX0330989.1 DEAD/DEAH box helicase [Oscillochloris sp. ZM17-4]
MSMPALNTDDLDKLAGEALTMVEMEEARLLSWGFMRAQSDLAAELPALLDHLPPVGRDLWDRARASGVTPDQIIANLVERRLVFENPGRHRSRFAEAVRLLFLLRQIMPWTNWYDAPRLVSDLRLQLQRRRYPRRDVPASALLQVLEDRDADEVALAAADVLLRDRGGAPLALARFQLDAAARLTGALRDRGDSGLVIGAGTGAGKTKAFYVPALAHIAAEPADATTPKAMAIYPRIELLKDQIAEAFSEARKLDGLLGRHGRGAIIVGAYYGDTPVSAERLLSSEARHGQGWDLTRARDGWVFPMMPCPSCGGDLVWRRADVQAEAEANRRGDYGQFARLVCVSCGTVISAEQISLTREQMLRRPPDILFTTTEMLNRRLSRTREHALFGVGVARPPRLLLLDEIHTYEGMGGAQVAHLLRRWRHARGRRPGHGLVVVGLSATLTQAEPFFARLTGLPIERVGYITPAEADMVEQGVEYNLVLKGDPVSGTSLLSTSVQAAMLLGRILDLPQERTSGAVSRGAYGQRIFAFTDTLDVINRWFHIEQDAESNKVLSQYRARPPRAGVDETRRRSDAGQWWWACERIGHDLATPLSLDITSSQYRGVRASADLVVATSSLEVGFNDPTVGAVIQHKAPRSLASFLQRKGRAGRTRAMRPWMVLITSAYGRDRWAFQHAERLFSPSLPPLELPLENTYVRKMQAAYALMDWLAATLAARGARTDVWAALSSDPGRRGDWLNGQRRAMAPVLADVLAGGEQLDSLRAHLDAALGLGGDDHALDSLLWAEPRPLLLEVVPTLLRQLESDWQRVEGDIVSAWSDAISRDPLPDVVTPNLFSLLSLPELMLHIPDRPVAGSAMRDDEQMGLEQGMGEYAPGHVSKRYARSHLLKEAHWLALPDAARIAEGRVQLADLAVERDPAARRAEIDGAEILVYRPRAYTLAIIPQSVLPTSSARLLWRSRFEAQSRAGLADEVPTIPIALAPDSPWGAIFGDLRAYTQAAGSWVEVTRAAVGVRAETRFSGGGELRRRLRFVEGEAPAALGFSLCVDALRGTFAPLDPARMLGSPSWPRLRQHLIPAYMLHRLERDPRLVGRELSDFELGWLWQLELSMLVATAVARQVDLPTAAEEVARTRATLAERTMDVIFQSQRVDEEDDLERSGRLRQRLADLIAASEVAAALTDCSAALWAAPDADLGAWLQECYAASLGAVLFDAVTRVASDIDPDDLTMDVEGDTIWIAERTPGGVGIIQRIAEAITRRPRDLDLQLLDTLRHCDRELLASQLSAVTGLIGQGDDALAGAFATARGAASLRGHAQALRAIGAALEPHGVPATRDLVVALNSKLLRPSSDTDSDALVAALAARWGQEQDRLGCAVDLRVMAVAAWRLDAIRAQVEQVLERVGGPESAPDESQVFNLLQSLLWLDCRDSCPDCIERGQPYQRLVKPSRALLRALVESASETIVYGEPGWAERVAEQLAEQYAAQMTCGQAEIGALREEITTLLTTPIDVGFQRHYPAVERVERRGAGWLVGLVIRDLAQR